MNKVRENSPTRSFKCYQAVLGVSTTEEEHVDVKIA